MASSKKPITLSNEEKKRLAYEWYMHTDKSQKEIAGLVGVSEVTLSKWSTENNWEDQKSMESVSKGAALKALYDRLLTMAKNENSSADDISKISAAIEKMSDKRTTIPNLINFFMGFNTWLINEDIELAKKLNPLQTLYINEQIRNNTNS